MKKSRKPSGNSTSLVETAEQHGKFHVYKKWKSEKNIRKPKKYKISRIRAQVGDKVTFYARPDGTRVTFFFPPGVDPFKLHGKTRQFPVRATFKKKVGLGPGSHRIQYAMYIHHKSKKGKGSFVQMNSEPEVIIDE